MRSLVHLLSVLLALPGVGLAAALLVFGSGIVTKSPSSFIGVVLDTGAWLLPWGLLACFVALVALVAGGLTTRFRPLASSGVALLAIGSSIAALILTEFNFSPEQLLFFVFTIVSALLSTWLAGHDRTPSEMSVRLGEG